MVPIWNVAHCCVEYAVRVAMLSGATNSGADAADAVVADDDGCCVAPATTGFPGLPWPEDQNGCFECCYYCLYPVVVLF